MASVRPGGRSDDGTLTQLAVSLRPDPYADESVDAVAGLREAARSADAAALVGGPTAEEADTRRRAPRRLADRAADPARDPRDPDRASACARGAAVPRRDGRPLLRRDARPGLARVQVRLRRAGSDAGLPTLVFLFTVALGVDYNIFLMARVREEARALGSRAGVVAGLEQTRGQ